MKKEFLGPSKKEPADSRMICKSMRAALIDTLQAIAIDSMNQKSIDSNTTPSIDITCEKASKVEILIAERDGFDIKSIHIKLMCHRPFHGFPHEQPMVHINVFGELILFIFNKVPQDHLF